MNIAIHRYFWERSPTWQRIYAEEQNLAQASANQQQEAENGGNESDHGDDEADGEDDDEETVHFDPVDARFLSSAPLVRGRIIKLLKATKNNIHAYTNILLAIVSR